MLSNDLFRIVDIDLISAMNSNSSLSENKFWSRLYYDSHLLFFRLLLTGLTLAVFDIVICKRSKFATL